MSFPLTSSLFSENPSLYTHLTSWLNPSRDLKPVFAMREPALAKNKSASDSLFFVALFAFRNFLSPRTLHWKESSGTFFWPLHTRSHQRIYRTFDHDWSRISRGRLTITFTTCHRYSSTYQDGVQRNITSSITTRFSFSYSGYFYASSVKCHFHVNIPSSNYSTHKTSSTVFTNIQGMRKQIIR